MARPREFDVDDAVGEALQVFWKQGYRGTSIPDLLQATGLERGSLYKAFSDKHTLFELAVNSYLKSARAALSQILDADGSPLLRLRTWMVRAIEGCFGAAGGRGCLAVNAMVELAPSDAKIRALLSRHWSLMERALEKNLREGQRMGIIRDDTSAAELARVVVRTIVGAAAFSRQGNRSDVANVLLRLVATP